jgi:hypothetical protein
VKLRILLALCLVALVLAARALLPGPAPEPAPAPAPRPPPAAATRGLADAVQEVLQPPPDPQVRLPPGVARRTAEAHFDAYMVELEQLADEPRRLPAARRDRIYREANDLFAALSAELDPASAEDMQLLEDANIRMKAMLDELGVKVPRRLPEPP